MRNKNKLKRIWNPAALACALAMMAMLAAAPAWAYTSTITNDTKHNVTVKAFQVLFPGVIEQIGVGVVLMPGRSASFHTTGAFCFYRYDGWYNRQGGASSGTPETQHWEQLANIGYMSCQGQNWAVRVKNGKFFFGLP
jgi:hypothetical protein